MVEPSPSNPAFELYRITLHLDADSFKTRLSSAVDAQTGECPENFKCGICLQLVHVPEECSQCDHIFCKDCIMGWRGKGNKTCPNCRKEATSQPLNRILKKILEGTQLKGCPIEECQASQTPLTYEQLAKHLQTECSHLKVSCPYDNCKQSFARSEALHHFTNQCDEVSYECPTCQTILAKREKRTHNCFKDFKLKISHQDKLISMLAERLDKMSMQMEDMSRQLSGQCQVEQKQQPGPQLKDPIPKGLSEFLWGKGGSRKKYFKGMKHPQSKIYKINGEVFCDAHEKKLVRIENTAPLYGCNACGQQFGLIAIKQGRLPDTLPRWQCRDCNCNICEFCIQSDSYLK